MPINELETHPYLSIQITNFNDKEKLSKYRKLIVGTFPIYAITSSYPIEETGLLKRANWTDGAFMQYFYGSLGNDFWELLSNAFDFPEPHNIATAIALLNENNILITDVFSQTYRNGYSPSDDKLINPVLNRGVVDIMLNCPNLQTIYFTSVKAKIVFGSIFNKRFSTDKDSVEIINDRQYRLIVLMTPSSTRSVFSFRHNFPLLQEELDNRNNGFGYAIAYRQRYYSHYLSIPLH